MGYRLWGFCAACAVCEREHKKWKKRYNIRTITVTCKVCGHKHSFSR